VGGDTTRGPLGLTVQLTGFVPPGKGMRRSGASPGDLLFVSGTVGDSAAGLAVLQSRLYVDDAVGRALVARHEYPTPRVALGLALRDVASACIDVSDGLAADASRLAAASGCGLTLDLDALPLSSSLRAAASESAAREFALQGGEDYELVFAVPEARADALAAATSALGDIACIGQLDAAPGLRLRSRTRISPANPGGWDHFRS